MLYKYTNIKQTKYANLGKKIEWSMIHMLMVYDSEEEWQKKNPNKISYKLNTNRLLNTNGWIAANPLACLSCSTNKTY